MCPWRSYEIRWWLDDSWLLIFLLRDPHLLVSLCSLSTAALPRRCPSAAWTPAAPSASTPRTRRTLSLCVLPWAWWVLVFTLLPLTRHTFYNHPEPGTNSSFTWFVTVYKSSVQSRVNHLLTEPKMLEFDSKTIRVCVTQPGDIWQFVVSSVPGMWAFAASVCHVWLD